MEGIFPAPGQAQTNFQSNLPPGFDEHHIQPLEFSGVDAVTNVVGLSRLNHAIAHFLLYISSDISSQYVAGTSVLGRVRREYEQTISSSAYQTIQTAFRTMQNVVAALLPRNQRVTELDRQVSTSAQEQQELERAGQQYITRRQLIEDRIARDELLHATNQVVLEQRQVILDQRDEINAKDDENLRLRNVVLDQRDDINAKNDKILRLREIIEEQNRIINSRRRNESDDE